MCVIAKYFGAIEGFRLSMWGIARNREDLDKDMSYTLSCGPAVACDGAGWMVASRGSALDVYLVRWVLGLCSRTLWLRGT